MARQVIELQDRGWVGEHNAYFHLSYKVNGPTLCGRDGTIYFAQVVKRGVSAQVVDHLCPACVDVWSRG
jgi:hypothetical protein